MTVRSLRVRDIFVTASQFSLSWLGMTDTQIFLRCRSCAHLPPSSPLSLSLSVASPANRAAEHLGSAATEEPAESLSPVSPVSAGAGQVRRHHLAVNYYDVTPGLAWSRNPHIEKQSLRLGQFTAVGPIKHLNYIL